MPQVEAPAGLPNKQGLIKYRYAMRAMKEMGYSAVGLGDYEASMPLLSALAEYRPERAEAARGVGRPDGPRQQLPRHDEGVAAGRPDPGANVKVGVTAALGPSVYDQVKKKDPSAKFGNSEPALKAVLKEMDAAKIDLPVLLYMGTVVGAAGRRGGGDGLRQGFSAVPADRGAGRVRPGAVGPAVGDRRRRPAPRRCW